MRTLLVGHQTAFARAVQGALVDCGFAVDVMRTLDEAAAALDCASYDILLLELALPDGDGLGLAEGIEAERQIDARDGDKRSRRSRSPDCKLQWWGGRLPVKAPVYR